MGLAIKAIREPRVPGQSAPMIVAFHAVKPRPPLWPSPWRGNHPARSVHPGIG